METCDSVTVPHCVTSTKTECEEVETTKEETREKEVCVESTFQECKNVKEKVINRLEQAYS